jgi:nitrite reductase (NO-forming)
MEGEFMTRSGRFRAPRIAAALLLGSVLTASAVQAAGTAPATATEAAAAATAAPATPPAPVVTPNAVPVQTDVPLASAFDPKAPPQATPGKVVEVTLDATLARLELSPGVFQEVWTFNGSVPAPTIRVHQGDTVRITLNNQDPNMEHGLDFHFAQADSGTFHKPIKPGESATYAFQANYPGVFFFHCSASPVIMHVANGMFGAVIVDPPGYKPAGKEYVLIQHEWYTNQTDLNELLHGSPKAMAFNGVPAQYLDRPLTALPGEPVRFYFVDAGPNRFAAFHVIGAIFDKVFPDGNPANELRGVQTVAVPPGGAVIADLVADTGTYPILTHALNDATKGALGVLKVGAPTGEHDPGSHGGGSAPATPATPSTPATPVGGGNGGSAGEPLSGNVTVSMANFTFSPGTLRIKAGTTVTWVNNESAPTDHTVIDANAKTPAERLFDSTGEKEGKARQFMKNGESFSYTFTTPGTYKVTCVPHPFMSQTIIVE